MGQLYYGIAIILGALGICWVVGTAVLAVIHWMFGL